MTYKTIKDLEMNSIRILKIFDRIMHEVYVEAKNHHSLIFIKITPDATEKDEVNLTALNLTEYDVGELIMHLLTDTIYASPMYAKMDYIPIFEMVRKNDDELQLYISRQYIERIVGY